MKTKIPPGKHLNYRAHNSKCERPNCHLLSASHDGSIECLMESVRQKWTNPSAVNYCEDPFAKKFVEKLHSESARKELAQE